MANKVVEKKLVKHSFAAEGMLDCSELKEESVFIEVEGEDRPVDLKKHLEKFDKTYIKLSIVKKDEEIIIEGE